MEKRLNIPKNALYIINNLENNGFEAYVVGGCVRDSLLGREPKDWDICTSATPQEIINCFPNDRIEETGIQHGTVSIILDGEPFEVTTYRIDGEYTDNRHPKEVEFVDNLKLDLSRRDFTINAMAYNPKTGIIDLFGGKKDIKKKIIRCVGETSERFNEDSLRMLRAIRFSAKYGFKLDENIVNFIEKNAKLIENISKERIQSELVQILSQKSSNMNEKSLDCVYKCLLSLDNSISYSIFYIDYNAYKTIPNNKDLRLAMFLRYSPKNDIINFLKILKFDNKTIENVSKIVDVGQDLVEKLTKTDYSWKEIRKIIRFLYKDNDDLSDSILTFALTQFIVYRKAYVNYATDIADRYSWDIMLIYIMISYLNWIKLGESLNLECFKMKNLEINGNDLKKLGFKGKEIKFILEFLLSKVALKEIKNSKMCLLKHLEDNFEAYCSHF